MQTSKTFYITTPIYYPSDNLHIGHAYTTVAADALARFKKLTGYEVRFLTGSDEHGQKIERSARERGETPQEYVDKIVAGFKNLWHSLNISYDDFIRTTEDRHKIVVQKVFQKLYDQGDIYKASYKGWYCTPCETLWTEARLENGSCPDCGRSVEQLEEESYFFKISKYADRMLKYIEDNPDFIQPASRRNEMVSFIKSGLEDLCVSRTTFDWGIPVPFDEKHVIYVWVDALTNYISALGYGEEDDMLFQKFWPADIHLVGKDIVRFHTIIWPIILMALELPLPKQVVGHGWVLLDSGKMSKSKGNVIDPLVLINKYGVDAIRYYLLREMPLGADVIYSEEALVHRINVDLANDFGNLFNRTCAMVNKYFKGRLQTPSVPEGPDNELIQLAQSMPLEVEEFMERREFSNALAAILRLVGRANKYLEETTPWALAKEPAKQDRLNTVLYNVAEALRFATVAVTPFMPGLPKRAWPLLGIENQPHLFTWGSLQWGQLPNGTELKRGEPLFPRIDTALLEEA
ncbi:Methionine--tRNA ligase [Sporotomaculum syntrophicum]|uniref:Methionine--tRNA ligase n=1 Tax=Sporotomaculum syntrophicum TaxID=182264 RepID=A0A9D2WQN8_9FIRM|nr:methionine--tRNA ligase [Sporotomaculum syntrophicum]KAF1085862.1 Methionine--tRNA ligase [Sporotomaculum syntrophicum]